MSNGNLGADTVRVNTLEIQAARAEARVGQLEGRSERTEQKLDSVLDRLARLEERVNHLPTKESTVKIALGTLAFLTAVTVLQGKIQALLGIAR